LGLELDKLEFRLDRLRDELMDMVLKLTREDAPKNKFTILTGRLAMLEDVKMEIRILRDASDASSK
jgi:hypothetical protein